MTGPDLTGPDLTGPEWVIGRAAHTGGAPGGPHGAPGRRRVWRGAGYFPPARNPATAGSWSEEAEASGR